MKAKEIGRQILWETQTLLIKGGSELMIPYCSSVCTVGDSFGYLSYISSLHPCSYITAGKDILGGLRPSEPARKLFPHSCIGLECGKSKQLLYVSHTFSFLLKTPISLEHFPLQGQALQPSPEVDLLIQLLHSRQISRWVP